MEYKVLKINDNGTATVELKVGSKSLNQDFSLGESPDDLKTDIKKGLAILKRDMKKSIEKPVQDYEELIDVSVQVLVKDLPDITEAELQDEPFGEVRANAELEEKG